MHDVCWCAEWAADARERELEKIALQHIKEQAKTEAREARKQVRTQTMLQAAAQVLRDDEHHVRDPQFHLLISSQPHEVSELCP